MARTRIKICGLRRPEEVEWANTLPIDYVGFVFAQGSRRRIGRDEAVALKARLDSRIKAVGVFVDERPETVAALVECGAIDIAQLHGGEDAAYIARLRALCGAPVIQAFRVRASDDLPRAAASPADLVLLDAGAGGGTAFDWRMPAVANFPRDYILAGGLAPDNVAEAVALLHPFAVDVSSGVETGGAKDFGKMERFVKETAR